MSDTCTLHGRPAATCQSLMCAESYVRHRAEKAELDLVHEVGFREQAESLLREAVGMLESEARRGKCDACGVPIKKSREHGIYCRCRRNRGCWHSHKDAIYSCPVCAFLARPEIAEMRDAVDDTA